jgi:hypothetical protein
MNKSLIAFALVASSVLAAWPATSAAQQGFRDKPTGYVRFDTDLRDNKFWLGGALPAGPVDLHGDLIVEGRTLEGDVGVAFYAGALAVLPMVGVSFDANDKRFDRLVIPRVFTVLEFGPLYFESWLQLTWRDPPKGGELNDFYTRDFLLYTVCRYFAFGPQVELRVALQDNPIPESRIISLPVGGQVATAWGGNRFALFLGYETRKFTRGDGDGIAWRFTYVRSW